MLQQQKQEQKEQEQANLREMRGAKLFTDGHVCVTQDVFFVQSSTDPDLIYEVENNECECPDFQKRQKPCKHIYAVQYYLLVNFKQMFNRI